MVYETGYMTKKTTFLPRLLGVELVVIGFEPVEIESVGFGLGLELGLGLGLGFGFEPVGFGLESVLFLQVRGLYSCVLRMPPHPVEFCHYYQ